MAHDPYIHKNPACCEDMCNMPMKSSKHTIVWGSLVLTYQPNPSGIIKRFPSYAPNNSFAEPSMSLPSSKSSLSLALMSHQNRVGGLGKLANVACTAFSDHQYCSRSVMAREEKPLQTSPVLAGRESVFVRRPEPRSPHGQCAQQEFLVLR